MSFSNTMLVIIIRAPIPTFYKETEHLDCGETCARACASAVEVIWKNSSGQWVSSRPLTLPNLRSDDQKLRCALFLLNFHKGSTFLAFFQLQCIQNWLHLGAAAVVIMVVEEKKESTDQKNKHHHTIQLFKNLSDFIIESKIPLLGRKNSSLALNCTTHISSQPWLQWWQLKRA